MNRKAYAGIFGLILLALVFLPSCSTSKSTTTPPVVAIAATSGTPQSAVVNMAFAAPLVATVTTGGTPTPNVTVTFTAPAQTGASGTFAGGANTATTNANGVATSAVFTANGTTGAYAVTASVAGATTPASFSLTNTGVVAITATSGSGQSTVVNTAFTNPLVATVTTGGTPTPNVTVTFTAPAQTGASGTFAGGVNTATTDANGMATSAVFTANGTAGGPYTVAASVAGATTPANFNLTNNSAETIAATSGTPQSATVNTAFAAPLVATVTTGGNPASGVTVTFTAPASGASGTFANGTATDTETTDVNGVATSTSFTANGATGAYTVTASATGTTTTASFSLTNNPASYAFYLTGLEAANVGPNFYGLAGSVTIDPTGTVLGGEQDYNDGNGFTFFDQITGGTLTVNATTGQGTLTLITADASVGVGGTETLGVQFVNTNHALIVQFDGSATSSGSMDLQTSQSTPLAGSAGFAFTYSGVDTSYNNLVAGGVFTTSADGTALSGVVDVDDLGTVTLGTAFTGTITAPDSFGRGTITGITGLPTTLSYYIVGPEAIRIINVDLNGDAGVGSAFGQGTGAFTAASLGTSVFGIQSNSWAGKPYAAAGMFTTDGIGTFSSVDDLDEGGAVDSGALGSGVYSISNTVNGIPYNGYSNLTFTSFASPIVNLGIYMTDPALNLNDPNNPNGGGGALVAELDATLIGTGVLVPQTDTAPAKFAGPYAFGAQAYDNVGNEFDFVGQGPVTTGGVLSGTGLLSDPFCYLSASPCSGADTGVTFSGTAVPDASNPGRYTMFLPSPLVVTLSGGTPNNFLAVIYQANGGQLFWVDEDVATLFGGSLEQQGSLGGLPAAKAKTGGAKSKAKQKQ